LIFFWNDVVLKVAGVILREGLDLLNVFLECYIREVALMFCVSSVFLESQDVTIPDVPTCVRLYADVFTNSDDILSCDLAFKVKLK
jgi:hypothetical protein